MGRWAAKYVGAARKLGTLIIAAQGSMDPPLMFSVFVVLTLLGVALYKGMEDPERTRLRHRYRE